MFQFSSSRGHHRPPTGACPPVRRVAVQPRRDDSGPHGSRDRRDRLRARRTGLPRVVVQASDGLPPYDFAIFEPPVSVAPRRDDDVTQVSGSERRDVPPRQDMVF